MAEPLLTFELFDDFIEYIQNVGDHKVLANVPIPELQHLIALLPPANRNLTRFLMHFLRELSKHQESTKMASSNLALVFGPNILRSKEMSAESLFGMNSSKLVEIFILHFDTIFGKE